MVRVYHSYKDIRDAEVGEEFPGICKYCNRAAAVVRCNTIIGLVLR